MSTYSNKRDDHPRHPGALRKMKKSKASQSFLYKNLPFLHARVVKNYEGGQISIDVDPGLSLRAYSKLSANPLIKIFRLFILIYSFPLTIVAAIVTSIVTRHYWYSVYYLITLFALIAAETYVSQKVTLKYALKSDDAFLKLHRMGVIKIFSEPEV